MSRASAASTSSDKRRAAACQRCHKRKVKCSGGIPCQNCEIASTICTFPTRDRNIVVSEAYIHRLQLLAQGQLSAPRPPTATALGGSPTFQGSGQPSSEPTVLSTDGSDRPRALPLTLKHATAESFVSGLKKFSATDNTTSPHAHSPNSPNHHVESVSDGQTEISNYDYVALDFDKTCENVSIQLPPYPYATQLVSQFEAFMAYEYHWYLRQEFKKSLEVTYRFPNSAESRNRTWLSKLLVVLALGESFNSYQPPLIDLSRSANGTRDDQSREPRDLYLPGVRFFEQALSLFKMPSEEPRIEHVEALNLIAFFCYSLNRRKTAYMYAGMSARIASSLMLHVPASTESAVVSEHKKRVWWTTFLMDAMVSSEMGLRAAFGFAQAEHAPPSDEHLTAPQIGEFWDSNIMTAHLKLCSIRISILETVNQLHETEFSRYEKVMQSPLRELESWRCELQPQIFFDFSEGVPQTMIELPSMRSLASCYLRYHQSYIMLLRPVFFKLLAIFLGKITDDTCIDGLLNLSSRCLYAAKCNMRIITTLSSLNKLAKYGFYDSLHLFSSIKIFSLSRLINAIRPLSLVQEAHDLSLYTAARELLLSMAANGNLASKGHMKMLEDIERQLDVVSGSQGQGQAQDLQVMDFNLEGITPWIDAIGGSDSFLDTYEFPQIHGTF